MARIVVLGGGRQGRVIAADLAGEHAITVADMAPRPLLGVRAHQIDVADGAALTMFLTGFDLAVGALPARLGFAAARAAVRAGRSYVDVAFYAEDARALDAEARAKGVAVLPDCGLAPGLSNLIVGRALAAKPRRRIAIYVGGVAADQGRPYGYVATWSLPDLVDEYTRPARIIQDGKVISVPALTGLETITFAGVGKMEAFFTDGLRTLLSVEGVGEMIEKTVRWPGHLAAVRPLLATGTLAQEIENKCGQGDDLVVMRIDVDGQEVTLVHRAQDGLSAMSRTTALTTAAFARYAVSGKLTARGVVPPEAIGSDPEAYRFILRDLDRHGIRLSPAEPFLP